MNLPFKLQLIAQVPEYFYNYLAPLGALLSLHIYI